MKRLIPFLIIAAVALTWLSTSIATVPVTAWGVETFLNRVTTIHDKAGLKLIWPVPFGDIEHVTKQTQVYELDTREFLTRDKKNILVSAYIVWRVEDPVRFWSTLRNDVSYAESRLADVLSSALGATLGETRFSQLITEDEAGTQIDKVTAAVRNRCIEVQDQFGMVFEDIRIQRLQFPDSNRMSVFRRMESERKRIATRFRSEGDEEASKIRAAAEQEKQRLLAEARRTAEQLRGEGEAEAARIFADAVGEDIELYEYLRTLEVYEELLGPDTTLVLGEDEPFLEIFFKGPNLDLPTPVARPTPQTTPVDTSSARTAP